MVFGLVGQSGPHALSRVVGGTKPEQDSVMIPHQNMAGNRARENRMETKLCHMDSRGPGKLNGNLVKTRCSTWWGRGYGVKIKVSFLEVQSGL